MNDQKNTILAIVLSAIVLIGWQVFYGLPQMQRQDAQKAQQAQQQAQPAPATAGPVGRNAEPAAQPRRCAQAERAHRH